MKRGKLSSIVPLGTALLVGWFFSVLGREDATLRNSLIDMSILESPRRRAALFEPRSILSGDVSSRTLTAAAGPYILRGTARVPPDVIVRIEPGTVVAAAEGAQLLVQGTLSVRAGTFLSIQIHPRRRFWYGIVVREGGRADLFHTKIADASVALTCGRGAAITVDSGVLEANTVGVVALPGASRCSVEGTRVSGSKTAFHIVGGSPRIREVTLHGVAVGVRVFHDAAPTIGRILVRLPIRTLVEYAASPDLHIPEVDVPAGLPFDRLVTDGSDAPTHRWQGQEYPTGRVRLDHHRNSYRDGEEGRR